MSLEGVRQKRQKKSFVGRSETKARQEFRWKERSGSGERRISLDDVTDKGKKRRQNKRRERRDNLSQRKDKDKGKRNKRRKETERQRKRKKEIKGQRNREIERKEI